jgi:hypothetical protein
MGGSLRRLEQGFGRARIGERIPDWQRSVLNAIILS